VQVTGRYVDARARSELDRLGAHIVFLPAIWPETYSYTLSIALQAGMLVSAFDIGAMGSRLRECGLEKALMPLDMALSPKEINRFLLSLLQQDKQDQIANTGANNG